MDFETGVLHRISSRISLAEWFSLGNHFAILKNYNVQKHWKAQISITICFPGPQMQVWTTHILYISIPHIVARQGSEVQFKSADPPIHHDRGPKMLRGEALGPIPGTRRAHGGPRGPWGPWGPRAPRGPTWALRAHVQDWAKRSSGW